MSARRQFAIAGAAAVAVIVLFAVFLYQPKTNEIAETREAIEQARIQQRSLEAELSRLEDARRNAPKTVERLATVERFLPDDPDLPGFIRRLQTVASRAGVDLRSIAPAAPADFSDGEGIQLIAVTVNVRGGFHRIEDFLSRIERLDRLVTVNSLTVAPTSDGLSDQITLETTMSLQMFVVQQDARIRTTAGGSS